MYQRRGEPIEQVIIRVCRSSIGTNGKYGSLCNTADRDSMKEFQQLTTSVSRTDSRKDGTNLVIMKNDKIKIYRRILQ